MLLEKISKELKNIIVSNFGERVIDGKCRFCKEPIIERYCHCSESQKINKYCLKASQFMNNVAFWVTLYDNDASKVKQSATKTPSLFAGMQFKDYKINNQSQQNAFNKVVNYSENALANYLFGKNLLLIGNYGTGKTMLMSILAKQIASQTLATVEFVSTVDLTNKIKSSFDSDVKDATAKITRRYKETHFLFLDDIDKINPTNYIKELMYSLVNYRIEHELPIVVSANSNIEELETLFGEATVSRLANKDKTITVQFTHGNWRIE